MDKQELLTLYDAELRIKIEYRAFGKKSSRARALRQAGSRHEHHFIQSPGRARARRVIQEQIAYFAR